MVKSVQYQSPYMLILAFSNNEVREFNFNGYLGYPVYEVLKDESFCQKAKVFNGIVVWDDSTDFDPDTLFVESKPLINA